MQKQITEYFSCLPAILDAVPQVLIGLDAEAKIVIWNQQAAIASQVTAQKAIGESLSTLCKESELLLEVVALVQKDRQPRTQKKMSHPFSADGGWVDVWVNPLAGEAGIDCMICIEDITKIVKIQDLTLELEKMKILAGLSAGMAHEINNPIGSIYQSTQNILRRISPDFEANQVAARRLGSDMEALNRYLTERQIFKFLDDIQKSVERTYGTISNILSFSRGKKTGKTSAELTDLVDAAIGIANLDDTLKKKYGFRRIRISRDFAKGLKKVACRPGEIVQVVFILIKNAVQAMAENKDPKFKPKMDIRVAQQGGRQKLIVTDNGPGISEADQPRIFEPFFSTRTADSGTGLGLFVAKHIVVRNHQGDLAVESKPGMGTVFTMTLPCDVKENNRQTKETEK